MIGILGVSRKFFAGLVLFLLAVGLCSQLNASPLSQLYASNTKSSKTQLKNIEKNLENLQKDVNGLKEVLDKESVKKSQEPVASISATYLPRLMSYLSEKGRFLKEGVFTLLQLQKVFTFVTEASSWEKILKVVTKALFSLILGLGTGYGVAFGLKVPFKTFTKWSKKEDISPPLHFFLSSLFILLPLIAFILSQLTCFFLLEYESVARRLIASSSVGGALLWMVWRLSSLLTVQPKPFNFLNKLNKATTPRFLSSIKGMALSYAIGTFFLDLASLLEVPYSGQKIISGIEAFFFLIFLSLMISAFQRPIRAALIQSRFFIAQALAPFWTILISVLLIGGYVLWLFDEIDLSDSFFPVVLSLLIVPACNQLIYWFRKLRLSYLWKKRRHLHQSATHSILKTGFLTVKLVNFSIYTMGVWFFFLIWEMQFLKTFRDTFGTKFFQQGIDVLILILAGYFLIYSGDQLLRYSLEAKQKESSRDSEFALARFKTLLRVAKTLIRIVVWVPVFLIIVSMNYDTTPIWASLGILTAGFAFAVRPFIEDFVTSFFVILENTLVVGDQVEIDGRSGTVEDYNLRTLQVRMDNGTLLTVPFSKLGIVGNKSRTFSCVVCNISISYGENIERIQQITEKAFQTLKKNPAYAGKLLAPLEIRGVNEVTDFSMVFQVKLRTAPSQQDVIRRGFNRILKQFFDEAEIKVPTPSYAIMGKNPSLTNTTV